MAGLTLLKAKPDKTIIIQLQGLEQTLNDDELETARDHFQQARMGGIPYAATLIAILGEVSTEPSEHPGHRHMRMLPLLFDEALLGVSDGVAQLLPLFLKEHHPLGFNNPGLTGALLKLNYYLPLNFVLEFRRPDSHYGPFTAGWLPSGALTWLVQQLMPQQDPKRESEASFNEILRQAKRKDSNAADEMLLTMDLLATQFNRMDLRYAAKLPGQVRLLQAINYPRFSNVPPIGPWITRKLLSQLAKPTSKLSTYLDWLGSFSYSMPDSAVPDVSNFQSWEPSGLAEIILPTSDPLSYCIDLQGQLQEQYGTQMPGLEIWIGRVVILHWYIDHLWRQRVIRDDSIDPPPPELFDLNSKLKTVIKQPGLREGLLSHMEFLLERDREAGIEPVIRTESNLKAKAADRQGSMPEPVPPQGTLEEIPDDPGFIDWHYWQKQPDEYFLEKLKQTRQDSIEQLEDLAKIYTKRRQPKVAGLVHALTGFRYLRAFVNAAQQIEILKGQKECQQARDYFRLSRKEGFVYGGYFHTVSQLICEPEQHYLVHQAFKSEPQPVSNHYIRDLLPSLFESAVLGADQAKLLLVSILENKVYSPVQIPLTGFLSLLYRLPMTPPYYRLKVVLSERAKAHYTAAKLLLGNLGHYLPSHLRSQIESSWEAGTGRDHGSLVQWLQSHPAPEDSEHSGERNQIHNYLAVLARSESLLSGNLNSLDLLYYHPLIQYFNPKAVMQQGSDLNLLKAFSLNHPGMLEYVDLLVALDSSQSIASIRRIADRLSNSELPDQLIPLLDAFALHPRRLSKVLLKDHRLPEEVEIWQGRLLLLHALAAAEGETAAFGLLQQVKEASNTVARDIRYLHETLGFPLPSPSGGVIEARAQEEIPD